MLQSVGTLQGPTQLNLFTLSLALNIDHLIGLSSAILESILPLRGLCGRSGVFPGDRNAWLNRLLRLSRAALCGTDDTEPLVGKGVESTLFLLLFAMFRGVSKSSDSMSDAPNTEDG